MNEAQIEEVYLVGKCSNVEIVGVETRDIQVCHKRRPPREALSARPPAGDEDDEWEDRLEAREQRMSEGLM